MSKKEVLEIVDDLDYLRIFIPDINGNVRSKILTSLAVPNFALHGQRAFQGIVGFGCEGTPVTRMLTDAGCGNAILKPDWSTLYVSKTAAESGARYKDVICNEFVSSTGEPYPTDTRHICQRAVDQLAQLGLQSRAAYEIEFRLFRLSDGQPAWEPKECFSAITCSPIEPYLTELDRNCRSAGLLVELMHSEYGSGQVEVNLQPQLGVLAADQGFLFKLIAKETARRHGYSASFMTRQLAGQNGNGWHLNLSVWTPDGKDNIFYSDGAQPGEMGKQFLAGLLVHAKALTAISSPTVNCYRRLHTPWAPTRCDYGVDNRMTTYRLQTSVKALARVESRIVSSACSPHLTLAATLFAGIDGIRRGLNLGDVDTSAELPHSLAEALTDLKADESLCSSLGQDIVRWFDIVKTDTEIQPLAGVDVKTEKAEDFERELAIYGRL